MSKVQKNNNEQKIEKEKLIPIGEQDIKAMKDYHFVSIPKQLIDAGIIRKNKKYKIYLEELEENHNHEKEKAQVKKP